MSLNLAIVDQIEPGALSLCTATEIDQNWPLEVYNMVISQTLATRFPAESDAKYMPRLNYGQGAPKTASVRNRSPRVYRKSAAVNAPLSA